MGPQNWEGFAVKRPVLWLSVLALAAAGAAPLRADELPEKVKEAVQRGLKWVSENQNRDGHWEANGGQYPTSMTALCSMTLLMEGSTLREGKYSDQIRRSV